VRRYDGAKKVATDGTLSRSSNNRALLLGAQLAEISDNDWGVVCAYEETVFGRTTPEQKLRIVNELKRRQSVVVVTGWCQRRARSAC
jgi:sodium/potassium-transporting ATPase subunit alpha